MPLTAYAAQPVSTNNATYYHYNGSTGESKVIDSRNLTETQKYNIKLPENEINKEKPSGDIQPLMIYEQLVRYDQSSTSKNLRQKKVNTCYVINSTPAPITGHFEATSSSSWEASGTVTGTGEAELNLMVSKVKATVSLSGTLSRSWTQGVNYGATSPVPAWKTYAFTGYIPGTTTNGNVVYARIYDGTGQIVGYSYYPKGAIVPSQSNWTIEVAQYN